MDPCGQFGINSGREQQCLGRVTDNGGGQLTCCTLPPPRTSLFTPPHHTASPTPAPASPSLSL